MGLIGFRKPRPLGVVRVNWLCLDIAFKGVLARPGATTWENAVAIVFIWKSKPQGSTHTRSGLGQGVLEYWISVWLDCLKHFLV